jgi:hypothetical protein
MPPKAFTLQVPGDAPYAEVAADAARKFVELMGGAAADGAGFAGAVLSAVRAAMSAGHAVTCAFSLQTAGVEAVITSSAGAAATVRQPIAVRSSES